MKAEDKIEGEFIEKQIDVDYLRPDDIRLVSSMLAEYSDKLESISTRYFNLQKMLIFFRLYSVIGGIACLCLGLTIWYFKNNLTLFFKNNLILFYLSASFSYLLISFSIIHSRLFLKDLKRKIRESTRHAQRTALRLDKLVRLGSQLYEVKANCMPVELPLQMIARIELDFCLTDAEAALEAFKNLDRHNKQ